jgi:hypothetical protein
VPFPIESAISGIMDQDYTNTNKPLLYRRFVTIPETMSGKDIILHFGAVDWKCEVYINGQTAGIHSGGYDPFSFNITPFLTASGEQEIQVQVYDPGDAGGQPHGKQVSHPQGIWYTPASGIWQTVWLEPVSETHLGDFKLTPDIDKGVINVQTFINRVKDNTTVEVKILDAGQLVATQTIMPSEETAIAIDNAKLWGPDSPFLYDLVIEIKNGDQVVDHVESYFGMRKISLGKVKGIPCMLLNNKPIFQYGFLDQGYWPDGIMTAPTDEALKYDLVMSKAFGMNMTRKHIKVEPARWYYHCDTMGLLVWQDMPNMSDGGILGDEAWVKANFYRELQNMMVSLRNYPSIVSWVIYNEGWGQLGGDDTHTLAGVEKALSIDTTRLINPASGWTNYETGDILDAHSYPTPGVYTNPLKNRASVCGEFGGITLVEEDHIWKGSGQEYISVQDAEELTSLFLNYNNMLESFQANGLCAAVYTELTDVEEELNGFITYDRKKVKQSAPQIAAIKSAVQARIHNTYVPVLPTALNYDDNEWSYSFSFHSNWQSKDYDASSWDRGMAGFGAIDSKETNVNTPWTSTNIYIRKTFQLGDLSPSDIASLSLVAFYDEDCKIYINGVLAAQVTGYVNHYALLDINAAARATLIPNGENVIAVKCSQTEGGQFIDVGLSSPVEIADLMDDNALPSFIKPVVAEEEIRVYPNPAEASFSIESIHQDVKSIHIYDLKGNMVLFSDHQTVYDISHLERGFYLLSIETADKVFTRSIVKK